jgi:hypothetical protein
MSQTTTWLSCIAAGTLTRSVVHFFPSSGGVSAPYPAQCKLTLFGTGVEPKSVILEGARLSQPDGLWLDDAFPNLRQGGGFLGLFIELHTPQPRVDITSSGCVVELHSALNLTRFWPLHLGKDSLSERRGALPVVHDPFQTSSLLLVNGSGASFRPKLLSTRLQRDGRVVEAQVPVSELAAFSVAEVPLSQTYFDDSHPLECSFGLLRMAGVELTEPLPADTAVYVLYRDASSTNPLSVCAL